MRWFIWNKTIRRSAHIICFILINRVIFILVKCNIRSLNVSCASYCCTKLLPQWRKLEGIIDRSIWCQVTLYKKKMAKVLILYLHMYCYIFIRIFDKVCMQKTLNLKKTIASLGTISQLAITHVDRSILSNLFTIS